jgi:hypothetical protein
VGVELVASALPWKVSGLYVPPHTHAGAIGEGFVLPAWKGHCSLRFQAGKFDTLSEIFGADHRFRLSGDFLRETGSSGEDFSLCWTVGLHKGSDHSGPRRVFFGRDDIQVFIWGLYVGRPSEKVEEGIGRGIGAALDNARTVQGCRRI